MKSILNAVYITSIMKITKLKSALFSILLTGLVSCAGNYKSGSSDSDTIVDSAEIKQEAKEAEKKDTVVDIVFNTKEDAVRFMENSGHWDEYQSGLIYQLADENLKYAGKLLNNRHKYFIVVDKAAMKVILYDKYGNIVKDYGMACSRRFGTKHRKADNRTPEGFFYAEGIYNSTDWLFTNDNGYTSPARGSFGPRFIRLKTPVSSQIGIHGTSSPRSIGRRVSHGCIRLTNANILDLVKYAEAGMPIIVSPGPKDVSVNTKEGYDVFVVNTGLAPKEKAEDKDKNKKLKKDKKSEAKKDIHKSETKTEEKSSEESGKQESGAKEEHKEKGSEPSKHSEPTKSPETPATPKAK